MNMRILFSKKYIKILKYAIVVVFFLVWVVFFDLHNFKDQVKYEMKISDLKKEKEYYKDKINEDSVRLHELNTDDYNLEKYAREKYLMKKQKEEIFLVKKQVKEKE